MLGLGVSVLSGEGETCVKIVWLKSKNRRGSDGRTWGEEVGRK